jgi:ribosomal protein L36
MIRILQQAIPSIQRAGPRLFAPPVGQKLSAPILASQPVVRTLSSFGDIHGILNRTSRENNVLSKKDSRSLENPAGLFQQQGVLTHLIQVRGYKGKVVLKKRCKGCYFEQREGILFVECTLKPRHKQRQVFLEPKQPIYNSDRYRKRYPKMTYTY